MGDGGQSSLEAAYTIPITFVLFLLLLQPAIIYYDKMVMNAAAAEGCRLLATSRTDGQSGQLVKEYILRRLRSIPPQPFFHLHEGTCSWNITISGGETASMTMVEISNKAKPLPLLDLAGSLLRLTDSSGSFEIKSRAVSPTQPDWIHNHVPDQNPDSWVKTWPFDSSSEG